MFIDIICDFLAGICGFFVVVDEYLRWEYWDVFYKKDFCVYYNSVMFNGLEFDSSMMCIGVMNLMFYGIECFNLLYVDVLSEQNVGIIDCYSLMLANLFFKGSFDYDFVEFSLFKVAKIKKIELFFLALMLWMMCLGGWAVVIVFDGVFFGLSCVYKAIWEVIVEEY